MELKVTKEITMAKSEIRHKQICLLSTIFEVVKTHYYGQFLGQFTNETPGDWIVEFVSGLQKITVCNAQGRHGM